MIGCPVHRREWIIEHWWEAACKAADRAEVDYGFIVVGDIADPTVQKVDEMSRRDEKYAFLVQEEESNDPIKRKWSVPGRYDRMVYLRNQLLAGVRKIKPDYFLSLDSDIILHENALVGMLEHIDQYDAVGSKCYLHGRDRVANWGNWRDKPSSGRFRRRDYEGFQKVDILMAIKLMTPKAYKVDYVLSRQGEDIGWSENCHSEGLTFGWDGTIISKHVMSPEKIGVIDERVGY